MGWVELGLLWEWEVLFVFNFFGGIILDVQGSYKDDTESSPVPFTQLPLMIMCYSTFIKTKILMLVRLVH